MGLLPPTTPETISGSRQAPVYLPPRQHCMDYVARFFDQVHCVYWFYSPEQFYPRLDRMLEDCGPSDSASWLCALYSIFAIGSMREGGGGPAPQDNEIQDPKASLDYLSMARDVSSRVVEEADLDSVAAFGILVRDPTLTSLEMRGWRG